MGVRMLMCDGHDCDVHVGSLELDGHMLVSVHFCSETDGTYRRQSRLGEMKVKIIFF